MTTASHAVDQARFEMTYAEKTCEEVADTFLSRVAEKALSFLYSKVPLNKPFNLVVRWIEPGGPESGPAQGMGDMSNALKTVRLFQKMFPTAHIFLTNKFYDSEDDTVFTDNGYLLDGFVVAESEERIQKTVG